MKYESGNKSFSYKCTEINEKYTREKKGVKPMISGNNNIQVVRNQSRDLQIDQGKQLRGS